MHWYTRFDNKSEKVRLYSWNDVKWYEMFYGIIKKHLPLHLLSWKQSFYLKGELIPIEDLKRLPVKVVAFLLVFVNALKLLVLIASDGMSDISGMFLSYNGVFLDGKAPYALRNLAEGYAMTLFNRIRRFTGLFCLSLPTDNWKQ